MTTKTTADTQSSLAKSHWLHWSLFPLVAAIGSAVLGASFYKWQLYGLFATEWLLVAGSICLGLYWVLQGSLPRIRVIPWLFGVTALYLVWSLMLERDVYWVLRHGVLLLYMSVAFWGWFYAHWKSQFNESIDDRLFCMFAVVGVVVYTFYLSGYNQGLGHGQFASFNIMMVGFGWWAVKMPRMSGKLLAGVVIACFLYLLEFSESRKLLMFIVLPTTIYLCYPRSRVFLLIVGSLAVSGVLFINIEGLSDANAYWRYQYWSGLFRESIKFSFGGLGQGFGLPYMPGEIIPFLYPQEWVAEGSIWKPFEYQIFSVAPHNGLLLLLKQLGLPAVVLFLLPVYRGLKRIGLHRKDEKFTPWLMAMAMLFPSVLSFPVLGAPYVSVFFFWCYGAFVYHVYRPWDEQDDNAR